ncbi:hypothetical protein LSH36_53g06001 [Paralvinella palmiformis]|uniref:SEC7 domain-containing protein n=1 Tax=Paralvinella palmiformis TaxID=53620 RepID=A0AAD9K5M0_9ANNE|nr:hypothetical protein LSH36_53g06001 [Paralvinella palmiformis]
MGQILGRVQQVQKEAGLHRRQKKNQQGDVLPKTFPDLNHLPPELALLILSNLGATDLCLAACVWHDLASDELLWHGLCRSQWRQVTAYNHRHEDNFSFKSLYLKLDEATLTFNADPDLGMEYLFKHNLVENSTLEIAKFIHTACHLDWQSKRQYLEKRPDVLEKIIELQDFEHQFLPNALRKFFKETSPPNDRNDYLSLLVDKFSKRFCQCNPNLGLSNDTVYVICFSLIMLSVDLFNPHIKNKMSKREFIRNTRRAAEGINDEFAGHLYDNIYLIGHVAPKA